MHHIWKNTHDYEKKSVYKAVEKGAVLAAIENYFRTTTISKTTGQRSSVAKKQDAIDHYQRHQKNHHLDCVVFNIIIIMGFSCCCSTNVCFTNYTMKVWKEGVAKVFNSRDSDGQVTDFTTCFNSNIIPTLVEIECSFVVVFVLHHRAKKYSLTNNHNVLKQNSDFVHFAEENQLHLLQPTKVSGQSFPNYSSVNMKDILVVFFFHFALGSKLIKMVTKANNIRIH
ncbi:hypothetical protein FF38_00512 [Lucilia cuprina]|uniref:Uncharacterized protein n=1 Tax=Lucilia cuprina TaxID=7375 RepID=A0A0L0CJS2_LUCCU|nr:hypothetical protein FF38_00512 [Lucilia cuprina]